MSLTSTHHPARQGRSEEAFDRRTRRVAIIAGNGSMPGEIYTAVRTDGPAPLLVGVRGEVDSGLAKSCDRVLSYGQLGSLFELLDKHGVRHVVFAGGIVKRPDFNALKPDLATLRELPNLLKITLGGDDSVLGKIATFLAKRNIEVVGVKDVAPGLLAEQGQIAGPPMRGRMPKMLARSLQLAWKGARAVGSLDAGQGCIVEDGRVVALEGAEGTDAMIARLGELRRLKRLNPGPDWSVLVKVAKPNQDMRADLPAIGPDTVRAAHASGLNYLAVEAGNAVVLDRSELTKLARQRGIRVAGFTDESLPQ